MTPTATEKKSKRRQRIRIILWSLLATTLAAEQIYLNVIYQNFTHINEIRTLLLLTGIGFLTSIAVTSKIYYNYGIYFIFFYLLYFLVPLFYGFAGLRGESFQTIMNIFVSLWLVVFANVIIYFLVFSIRLCFLFRKNRLIQSFGILSGILAIMAFINFQAGGILFSTNYNYITLLFLVIFALAILFMLPGIDLDSWFSHERKVLYRMILTPFAIVLVLNIILNIFPDLLRYGLYGSNLLNPWGMQEVELLNLEGISPTTQ